MQLTTLCSLLNTLALENKLTIAFYSATLVFLSVFFDLSLHEQEVINE